MSDLAKKLGSQPQMSICILGAPPGAEEIIRKAVPGPEISISLENPPYHMILFWPNSLESLVNQFAVLQGHILPDGAIWAVIPKKKFAPARGLDFSWEEMQAAGLSTDLVDNKVASISEQDYGTRFVIRKERRKPV